MAYQGRLRWPFILIFGAMLSGCISGGSEENLATQDGAETDNPVNGGVIIKTVSGASAGRLLASNCFQCHGTNGDGGFDRLLGEKDLLEEMREFAASNDNDIMSGHARGYTDAQLQSIANYLANP